MFVIAAAAVVIAELRGVVIVIVEGVVLVRAIEAVVVNQWVCLPLF